MLTEYVLLDYVTVNQTDQIRTARPLAGFSVNTNVLVTSRSREIKEITNTFSYVKEKIPLSSSLIYKDTFMSDLIFLVY